MVTLCVDVVMADGRHTHMVTTREWWRRARRKVRTHTRRDTYAI